MDEPFVPHTITPEQRAKVDQGEAAHPNKPSPFAFYERWVIPFIMLFLGWPLYLVRSIMNHRLLVESCVRS
jgi:hypothetical protein